MQNLKMTLEYLVEFKSVQQNIYCNDIYFLSRMAFTVFCVRRNSTVDLLTVIKRTPPRPATKLLTKNKLLIKINIKSDSNKPVIK